MWLISLFLLVLLGVLFSRYMDVRDAKEITLKKLEALQVSFHDDLHKQLDRFRNDDLAAVKESAYKSAQLQFERWKADYTYTERADAVKKSRAVNRGLVSEQLAPHLSGFSYNPKDCRFLGSPIDYVVFDGLDSGLLKEIVLVDVKTGEAKLNARQVQVKNICAEKKIRFETFRPGLN